MSFTTTCFCISFACIQCTLMTLMLLLKYHMLKNVSYVVILWFEKYLVKWHAFPLIAGEIQQLCCLDVSFPRYLSRNILSAAADLWIRSYSGIPCWVAIIPPLENLQEPISFCGSKQQSFPIFLGPPVSSFPWPRSLMFPQMPFFSTRIFRRSLTRSGWISDNTSLT